MKKTIFQTALVLLLVTLTVGVFAQNPPGAGGATPGPLPPGSSVPIDGGVGLLLAGVVGYAYKLLKGKKEE